MNTADTWITRDGRQVPISDMDSDHLRNTIKFLRRRSTAMRMDVLKRMSRYIAAAPDGAAMACEAEADQIIEMGEDEFLSAYVPQWKCLIMEASKR